MRKAGTIVAVFTENAASDSVVGKGFHSEGKVLGFHNMGDRIKFCSSRGAFWSALWGVFFGGLFLTTALSTAIAAPASNGYLQLADGEVPVNDRLSYMHQAQVKMQDWKHKLRDLGEKEKASGKNAEASADEDLKTFWGKTKAASRKLQAASADNWENARASFESESHNLEESWKKRHPDSP